MYRVLLLGCPIRVQNHREPLAIRGQRVGLKGASSIIQRDQTLGLPGKNESPFVV